MNFGFDTPEPVTRKVLNTSELSKKLSSGDAEQGEKIRNEITQQCQITIRNVPIQKIRETNKYVMGATFDMKQGTVGYALSQFLRSSARAYVMIGTYDEPKYLNNINNECVGKGRLYVIFLPTPSDKEVLKTVSRQLFDWKTFVKTDGILLCSFKTSPIVKVKVGVSEEVDEETAHAYLDEIAHRYFEAYFLTVWGQNLKTCLSSMMNCVV